MNVVIIGVGRVGARLATLLHTSHRVSVLDIDQSSFGRLPADYQGEVYRGNGIDIDTLKAAGAGMADVVIAVTNGDNRNLMAAQVAKRVLNVPRAIARVYDPVRAEIFSEMGLETISSTVNGAERLHSQIVGE